MPGLTRARSDHHLHDAQSTLLAEQGQPWRQALQEGQCQNEQVLQS
jgi:hypothetical protein